MIQKSPAKTLLQGSEKKRFKMGGSEEASFLAFQKALNRRNILLVARLCHPFEKQIELFIRRKAAIVNETLFGYIVVDVCSPKIDGNATGRKAVENFFCHVS